MTISPPRPSSAKHNITMFSEGFNTTPHAPRSTLRQAKVLTLEKSTTHPRDSITLCQDLRGQELEEEIKVWKETAASEARIRLMQEMKKEKVSFADIEHFEQEIYNKFKSQEFKSKSTPGNNLSAKVTKQIMEVKLLDE